MKINIIDQQFFQNLKRLKIIIPNTPLLKVSLAWPLKPNDSLKIAAITISAMLIKTQVQCISGL